MAPTFDVAVVGGGPAGACLAALLVRGAAAQGRSLGVVLLEPGVGGGAPATEAPQSREMPASRDLPAPQRVVALSRASENILRAAGAWPALEQSRPMPYERMRVWHESGGAHGADALAFDAAEAGQPNLGYIATNAALQEALLEAGRVRGVVRVSAALTALQAAEGVVCLSAGGESLNARLVVGADGARSAVREMAGLGARLAPYGQTAIVATVATQRSHEATAWQRFMADGTLAFLPLVDGTSSIVWSADDELARELLALDPQQFTRRLDRASGLALGETRLLSALAAFPLRRLDARRYVSARLALVGDAAHVVHPLAGQGVNLGLTDAATLAELLLAAVRRREDPGALGVLRAYERWRRSEVALMSASIDAFDRLLSHGTGPLALLARRSMGVVGRSQELRRLFIERALGLTGELPRTARGGAGAVGVS
ncbi:MAG: FAD-dependent monooxygenase [Proteobacteria bacterium]|nr:FAD-dependent monooxygenase [Pseudomonadota bacterium]